jgi:hypothetical protein
MTNGPPEPRRLAEFATDIISVMDERQKPRPSRAWTGHPWKLGVARPKRRNIQFTVKFMVFVFVPPPYIPPVVRT